MSKRTRHRNGVQQPRDKERPRGPGKTFIEEGEGESLHLKNVGDHPLDLAYERGMFGPAEKRRGGTKASLPPHPFLQGGRAPEQPEREGLAEKRYRAGKRYRYLCQMMYRSGLDSTQLIDRTRSSEPNAAPFSQTQVNAAHELDRIDTLLGGKASVNYLIVRHFCGDGYSAAEAVMSATGCHPSNVKYRLSEALDALADALWRMRPKKAA